MITDYFTKPLQGALFKNMRDIIMGLTALPDEGRVNIGEIVSGVSSKNKNKSPVECGSTDNARVLQSYSRKIRDGMMDTRDVGAGGGRMTSYTEIVMKNINNFLSSSGGQVIDKPSEQSFSKLIKI